MEAQESGELSRPIPSDTDLARLLVFPNCAGYERGALLGTAACTTDGRDSLLRRAGEDGHAGDDCVRLTVCDIKLSEKPG
jgi:hypothetical protein